MGWGRQTPALPFKGTMLPAVWAGWGWIRTYIVLRASPYTIKLKTYTRVRDTTAVACKQLSHALHLKVASYFKNHDQLRELQPALCRAVDDHVATNNIWKRYRRHTKEGYDVPYAQKACSGPSRCHSSTRPTQQ